MQSITRRQFSSLAAGLWLNTYGMHLTAGASQANTQIGHAPRYPLTGDTQDGFAAFMAYDPAEDPDAPFFRSTSARHNVFLPLRRLRLTPS